MQNAGFVERVSRSNDTSSGAVQKRSSKQPSSDHIFSHCTETIMSTCRVRIEVDSTCDEFSNEQTMDNDRNVFYTSLSETLKSLQTQTNSKLTQYIDKAATHSNSTPANDELDEEGFEDDDDSSDDTGKFLLELSLWFDLCCALSMHNCNILLQVFYAHKNEVALYVYTLYPALMRH